MPFQGRASSAWGFGLSASTRRDDLCSVPERFGRFGASWYSDPGKVHRDLLTRRVMDSPQPPRVMIDFLDLGLCNDGRSIGLPAQITSEIIFKDMSVP